MDDMVERVARAIAQEILRQDGHAGPVVFDAGPLAWSYVDQGHVDFGLIASAAIEAMRVPTEAMVDAGTSADWVGEAETRAGLSIMPDSVPDWNSDDDRAVIVRPGIWPAMIDAALKRP